MADVTTPTPDDVLSALPADGTLPDTLPDYPTQDLAYAWCAAKGGPVDFFELVTAKDANGKDYKKAVKLGQWEGAKPHRNPFTGEMQPSTVPPQLRTVDDLKRRAEYQESLNPKPTPQPDWNYGAPGTIPTNPTPDDFKAKQTPITRPQDPYSSALKPLPDPITGTDPVVSGRDPWTAMWTVSGSSGLTATSNQSVNQAIQSWNNIVAVHKAAAKP
ncbi:hypothetical protein NUL63_004568 [Salmonella enterica]|nr:hypothetical protein [Salmonella enterica]